MNEGYIMLKRGRKTEELLQDPKAFALLTLIALRAKRTDAFCRHGLEIGQALVGDYQACGLTIREYRGAKARLQRYGLARLHGTPKGTIATLCDTSVFDINDEGPGQTEVKPGASPGPAKDQRRSTNKNDKNEKDERSMAPSAEAERLAKLLLDSIRQRQEDLRRPDLGCWARDMDRLIRLDGREPERIEAVLRWCQCDPFWQNNILSPAALRKHFDRLELQMRATASSESTGDMIARMEREGKL